jgi:flagellar M-ring protein FliF
VVDDSGIIRSQQDLSESYNGTSTQPGGAAGVQSNVPGYVAQNANANAEYEKKESTKNYEINEEKSKTVAAPGSIRRLTVAVLVDDTVTPQQQDSIMRTVSSAAGINTDRGDTVSVEPLPFSTELRDKRAAEEQAAKDREDRIFYGTIAAILLVLAAIGGYLYYRRKKKLEAIAAEQERIRQEEEARKKLEEEERAALLAAGALDVEELTEEEQQHLTEKQTLQQLIDQRPAEVAMLVKTWLAEE